MSIPILPFGTKHKREGSLFSENQNQQTQYYGITQNTLNSAHQGHINDAVQDRLKTQLAITVLPY